MAKIIDGRGLAQSIRAGLKGKAAAFEAARGRKIGLAVVLVGADPASQIYVRNKERACAEVGFASWVHRLPEGVTEAEILGLIEGLNKDNVVDGILVQLPLPRHIDERKILSIIDARKDVDGFGHSDFVPCTPLGCIELLKSTGCSLEGKHAVVVGRSNIVGKPAAMLLLQENCTVTICHSKTVDLAGYTRRADVLVVAIGRKHFITADMIKPGAVVIDVGINRDGERVTGDVDFKGAQHVASHITPVPGGVGPMTIAMLLQNTFKASQK